MGQARPEVALRRCRAGVKGGGGLHIAHMLWGGLLMLVALVLLLAFLGTARRRLAAVVGGVGFGTFVDELGKFITSDNDYFYKPTIGLLYVLFVLLFLAFRTIERRRPFSPAEALANATDTLRELVLGGATPAERARALRLLEDSGDAGPFAGAVRAVIAAAPAAAETMPSLPARLAARSRHVYDRLIAWRWFGRAIVVVFLLNAVLGLLAVITVGAVLVVRRVGWPGHAARALGGRELLAAPGERTARRDAPAGWPGDPDPASGGVRPKRTGATEDRSSAAGHGGLPSVILRRARRML